MIYIDRLKKGNEEKISFMIPPSFMEIDEEQLKFIDPIAVFGKAYLTEEHLVLHLTIQTSAQMPCKMCNIEKAYPVHIDNYYHTENLTAIQGGIFSMAPVIRDAILLDIPAYYACDIEECEGKQTTKKILKSRENQEDGESYHPFANLE